MNTSSTQAQLMAAKINAMKADGWSINARIETAISGHNHSGYARQHDQLVVYYSDKSMLVVTHGRTVTGMRDD